ncbi:MAG: glycoside hydrolase family 5 protein [Acidimicrobiales bacterium]
MALLCAACAGGSSAQNPSKTTLKTPSKPTDLGLAPPKTTVASKSSTLPALKVAGSTLELTSGQRLVMRGVVVYAVPFYETRGAPDPELAAVTRAADGDPQAMFARIKALGFNTVKIPISTAVYSNDPYAPGGAAGYLARLQAIVDTATAQGLFVDLSWWDALAERHSVITEYSSQFPMMNAVADTFRNNPNVIYEPLNEPNGITLEQWLVTSERVIEYWRATIGYRGVLIADTRNWSWSFNPTYVTALIRYDKALLGQPELLIANNRFPNGNPCFCETERAVWDSLVGQYIGRFPLVGTQYGIADSVGKPELRWGQDFAAYLKSYAIPSGFNGALAFVWNWVGPNTMTVALTGELTPWGKAVVQSLASPPRL